MFANTFDEHESNKEIGEKGERIIFEILKKIWRRKCSN